MLHQTMPPVSVSAQPKQLSLSRRLWQTLEHLLDGRSEKEVASALQISAHTVHTYVKRLYSHFGVETRAELMARFVVPVRGALLRALLEDKPVRSTAELIDELFTGNGPARNAAAAAFEGVAGGMAFGKGWVRALVPQGTFPEASSPGDGAGPSRLKQPRPVL